MSMEESTQTLLAQLFIATGTQLQPIGKSLQVDLHLGKPIFILGKNGTGKSAMMQRLYSQVVQKGIFLPGSRSAFFENEQGSLTPASRDNLTQNLRSWDSSPDIRWRLAGGSSRNEKAIHDLQAAETKYKVDAANEIARDENLSSAITRLQSHNSPLDRINALLHQGNLPIQLSSDGVSLKATQSNSTYSYARLSDGERSALILASEIISAAEGSIFFVDEPELHLHPSIVVPLLNALIAERPDCGFVISTHELRLAADARNAQLILVRNACWGNGSVISWDVDVIYSVTELPRSLQIDVLGARRKILFIEGSTSSLDQPLYALLFPNTSICPKESCRDVMQAVNGLRSVMLDHQVEAFGLVDLDGMEEKKSKELEAKGIYTLPVFSVESLYYSNDVLLSIAKQQATTFGTSAEALIEEAKSKGLEVINSVKDCEHLASRVAERRLRDKLLDSLPSRELMIKDATEHLKINLQSPYPDELKLIYELLKTDQIDEIISRYPVRETRLLDAVAKGLKFSSRQDYERAALTRIRIEEELRSSLRSKLGALSSSL